MGVMKYYDWIHIKVDLDFPKQKQQFEDGREGRGREGCRKSQLESEDFKWKEHLENVWVQNIFIFNAFS